VYAPPPPLPLDDISSKLSVQSLQNWLFYTTFFSLVIAPTITLYPFLSTLASPYVSSALPATAYSRLIFFSSQCFVLFSKDGGCIFLFFLLEPCEEQRSLVCVGRLSYSPTRASLVGYLTLPDFPSSRLSTYFDFYLFIVFPLPTLAL